MRWALLCLCLVALLLPRLADAGDPYQEGLDAYERGDYPAALEKWRPLAESGDAWAQNVLGKAYDRGVGVPQDSAEAVKWFRMAADQGHANAQNKLGAMYDNGRGVARDYAEAAKWFRLAADQGLADAQYKLGVMYYDGRGVPQHYVLAHMWLNLAAAGDVVEAFEARDAVAEVLTPAQLAEAQRMALAWQPKSTRVLDDE